MKFVILAAGKSSRIYKKIKTPKALLKIKNKSLIKIIVNDIFSLHKKYSTTKKINIVVGFKKNLILKELKEFKGLNFILNKDYKNKDMLHSLILGLNNEIEDTIMIYSDIYFNKQILEKILKINSKSITIPVLKNWKNIWKIRNKDPLKDAEQLIIDKNRFIVSIGKKIKKIENVSHQYMGIIYFPKQRIKNFIKFYKSLNKKNTLHVTNFLDLMIRKKHRIKSIPLKSFWYEFDDYQDFLQFKRLKKN